MVVDRRPRVLEDEQGGTVAAEGVGGVLVLVHVAGENNVEGVLPPHPSP